MDIVGRFTYERFWIVITLIWAASTLFYQSKEPEWTLRRALIKKETKAGCESQCTVPALKDKDLEHRRRSYTSYRTALVRATQSFVCKWLIQICYSTHFFSLLFIQGGDRYFNESFSLMTK